MSVSRSIDLSGASRWMMAVNELFNARFRVISFETQSWSM